MSNLRNFSTFISLLCFPKKRLQVDVSYTVNFSFFWINRYTGATIHFVDENYDTGRILAQQVVPVFATDTAEVLAARVLQEVLRFIF